MEDWSILWRLKYASTAFIFADGAATLYASLIMHAYILFCLGDTHCVMIKTCWWQCSSTIWKMHNDINHMWYCFCIELVLFFVIVIQYDASVQYSGVVTAILPWFLSSSDCMCKLLWMNIGPAVCKKQGFVSKKNQMRNLQNLYQILNNEEGAQYVIFFHIEHSSCVNWKFSMSCFYENELF